KIGQTYSEIQLLRISGESSLVDLPPYSWGDHSQLVHQLAELFGKQGLGTVRQSFFRIAVNFDQQGISTCRHSRACHGRNLVAAPRAMRWIGRHGKMRELVDGGD